MSSTTSKYLNQKTSDLETQTQVSPSQARVAQIPLQTFTLPTFPPEAKSLTSLTLTSDIKLDEYMNQLIPHSFPELPSLPSTIESLTLELFSLGYPPPFLTTLSSRLPNLKSLVIYSQLFAGTTDASLADSIQFFKKSTKIQALHLLDVFVSPKAKFFPEIAPTLRKSLRFLEVNYTFRHSDNEFLKGLPVKDLPCLVGKELISCVFGMSAPDITDDEDDREGEESGILAVEEAGDLVEALIGEESPKGLLALDTTLFKLSLEQLGTVLEKLGSKLSILAVTVELGGKYKDAGVTGVANLLKKCSALEEVEIVGFPADEEFVEKVKEGKDVAPMEEEFNSLAESCKQLRKVKTSILRTREIVWINEGGKWKKM